MRLVGSPSGWSDAASASRVLGVDPGSRILGWGVVESLPGSMRSMASGTATPRSEGLASRLAELAAEVEELIGRFRPGAIALERAFVGRNSASALRIGEVRGAVLATAGRLGLRVFDYPPATVKLAVSGSGLAGKDAVARGVGLLLGEVRKPGDASDALAVAICHLRHAVVAGQVEEARVRVAPRGGRSLLRTPGLRVRVRR